MSESLRVLRVSTDTYPEVIGGAALHAHEISRMQAEMGHDVMLLTSNHGNLSYPHTDVREGYRIKRYSEVARPFGNSIMPKLILDLPRLAKNYDIVHAHSHLYFSSNIAGLISRFSDTPLVLTNHGVFSQTAPKLVQAAFMRTIGTFTFESADRVLCYTDTDRQRLIERGIKTPISVIPNGVDCELFTPDAGSSRVPRILFVGRFKAAKGPQRLIKAFSGLAADFPKTTLTLVGEGPLKDELVAMTRRYNIENRVEFTGRLKNKELPEMYAESLVFVLPSDMEGLPRTVLEALACETPVITSNLPQLEPLVDEVGKTVPKGDIDKLESTLREILENRSQRQEYGRQGRTLVVDEYSWKETVRRTTEVYYELLDML